MRLTRSLCIASLVCVAAFLPLHVSCAQGNTLTAEQWRADLAFLSAEWPRKHKSLFHTMTEEQFRTAVSRLDADIPSLQRHEIIVRLARIAAMISDSHSGIGTLRQEAIDFHRLPLEFYLFSDGLFIRRAATEHAALAGARVVRIGNVDARVAIDSVSKYVSADPGNIGRPRDIAPIMLSMPEVLDALHFTTALTAAPLTLELNGRTFDTTVVPVTRSEYGRIVWHDAQTRVAVARRRPNVPYWFEYLAAERTMYVQLNTMDNDTTEGIPVLFHRALRRAEALGAQKLVLDVRENGGGSSNFVRDIVIDVIKSTRFDQHGHFFVLIGRVTASAAQNLVNELERLTNAVLIGEPTAQGVQFWSDANTIELPNSRIIALGSSIWFQSFEARDRRPFTPPQVAAEASSRDYIAGADPAMTAVRAYRATLPVPQRILAVARKCGVQAAGDSLAALRHDAAYRYRDLSHEMIRFTFDRVWITRNFVDGVLLLEANAIGSPDDWNSHDALAGAYEDRARLADAEREYLKAAALSPRNEEIERGLQRVRAKIAQKP